MSASPVVATAYVALLNVLALALSAALVYRYAGRRAAYFTAVLYALDAWAVIEARKIWAPYVVALFAVLAFWGVLLLVVERRRWGAALALGSWLWLVQLHPSTALLAPVLAAALWLGRRALRPPPLLAGLAVGVAPLFPLQNATGLGAGDLQGIALGAFLPPGWPAAALSVGGVVLLIVGFGGALLAVFARRPAPNPWSDGAGLGAPVRPAAVYGPALLWLAVPTLLALRETTPYFAHYFMALLPVTFIAVGLGLDALCRQLGRAGVVALVGLTTISAAFSCLPALAV